MTRHFPILAACAGLAICLAVILAMHGRAAEAAGGGERFARPDYERTRKDGAVDLSRYAALADPRLIGLRADAQACRDALAMAGVAFATVPDVRASNGCGFDEAVMVKASLTGWRSSQSLPMTCDLAARLHLWERHIVIPAAEKWLGSPVAEMKVFGSFQCRKVAGHDRLSEHAFAKAADIAGFVLADGREVSVLKDFRSKGPKGDFLREVRARACDIFDVTLGPDFNADHANHFHLDVGGGGACR